MQMPVIPQPTLSYVESFRTKYIDLSPKLRTN